ncbi:MAG: hypothetical protein LQ350_006483 [Teloschistes chrysophthalmus]|nr:MAG: hypothetical protein LQ350_006483 [Niorma chrysophthalma]
MLTSFQSTSTTTTPTATTSANLLKNGDFEATKAGDVAWTTLDQDGGVVVNFMAKKDSTTAPHGGAQQLSIAFNTVGGKNDETFGQSFTATRATNYKFSIFTFAPVGGDKCQWDFYISDSTQATTIATTSLSYSSNDDALGKYVQTTLAFNSGTNTALVAYATLDCTAYKPGTAITFYADDASVATA